MPLCHYGVLYRSIQIQVMEIREVDGATALEYDVLEELWAIMEVYYTTP